MTASVKKNRSEFSNSQDKKYEISSVENPQSVETKDDKVELIIDVQMGKINWTKINLKQKLKNPDNWSKVMSGNLLNLGYRDNSSTYPKINSRLEDIRADFVFLDFDNKHSKQHKEKPEQKLTLEEGYLSYEEALDVLKASGYNYVLSTSHSHSDTHHKLHILIPILKSIQSAEEYKIYFHEVSNMFKDFDIDPAVSSIANNKNSGNKNNCRVDVEFSKNDYHVEIDLNSIRTLKKTSNSKGIKAPKTVDNKDYISYGHQAKNMYGLILDGSSTLNSMKFRRNRNDKGPGVFNVPYSDTYNPNLIFDNNKEIYTSLFQLDDYVKAKEANTVRDETQGKIRNLIEEWLYHGWRDDRHMYLITNEGLGKSTSVLGLAKNRHTFIYATHSRAKMEETGVYLNGIGVPYKTILSVEDILKKEGCENIVPKYKKYVSTTDNPSFREFIKSAVESWKADGLINAYERNNRQVQEHSVILMTNAKLKIMLEVNQAGILSDKKAVILDEFLDTDWLKKIIKTDDIKEKDEKVGEVHITWGLHQEVVDDDSKYNSYKQPSFSDLLASRQVLVLSTERSLVELIFHDTEYKEMSVPHNDMFRFKDDSLIDADSFNLVRNEDSYLEHKLKANNVTYLLVGSTSKDKAFKQLEELNEKYKDLDIVIISNGMKNEDIDALSHMGIKGKNDLSNENTLILGSVKNEIQVKNIFINTRAYFEKRFHFSDEMNARVSNKTKELSHLTSVELSSYLTKYTEKLLIGHSEKTIQEILIQTEISQSIGRSQGFRFKNKMCYVVLPIMHSKSNTKFSRNLKFNYVSENVHVSNWDSESGFTDIM